ncbi:methanogenesis marker 6 protein [Methanothermococcus sp. Ax23]|jgi:putative methanogenesis marker protein 6|uniref:methanogenesis marker 6 protein n=1 Tax=Methanothermococcus sp. Ax23 TaxID=3156486 RepID=UPI003BA1F646
MKTKVIVLSEDAKTSPSKLFRFLNSLDYNIKVKETCFGAYIEGEDEVVDEIANIVRNLEKNKIFCKDRGFPIWDKRRCRAFRKGGPREGFHQLEAEQKALELISKGLEEVEKEDGLNIEEIDSKYNSILEKYKRLDINKFKEIVESIE